MNTKQVILLEQYHFVKGMDLDEDKKLAYMADLIRQVYEEAGIDFDVKRFSPLVIKDRDL